MRTYIACALALLVLTPSLLAADADAIAALRAKIEEQAAQVEALRAELARLEAEMRRDEGAPPAAPAPPPAPAPKVKFGGLLQSWYAAGDEGFNDTFRIRRAELKFTGEIGKTFGWTVMIDPAKSLTTTSGTVNQASRVLQDAFITVAAFRGATLQMGQYRIPLSREGLEPASALDTVERALFLSDRARGGGLGDIRDLGLALRGTLNKRFDYYGGIFNGSGESQNDTDREDRKTLIGRFVAHLTDDLRLGVSGAQGGSLKNRLGGDILYTHGPLKLAAELMTGKDGAIERRGFYAHAGYRFLPRLEGIVRVDQFDPDTSSDTGLASAEETDYILGINLSPTAGVRFQANAIHKVFSDDALPSRNVLLLNLQTSW